LQTTPIILLSIYPCFVSKIAIIIKLDSRGLQILKYIILDRTIADLVTNEYSITGILENIPCYQYITRINEHGICQEICAISIVIVEIIIFNDDKACI